MKLDLKGNGTKFSGIQSRNTWYILLITALLNTSIESAWQWGNLKSEELGHQNQLSPISSTAWQRTHLKSEEVKPQGQLSPIVNAVNAAWQRALLKSEEMEDERQLSSDDTYTTANYSITYYEDVGWCEGMDIAIDDFEYPNTSDYQLVMLACWEACYEVYGDALVGVDGPCYCQDECDELSCDGQSIYVRSDIELPTNCNNSDSSDDGIEVCMAEIFSWAFSGDCPNATEYLGYAFEDYSDLVSLCDGDNYDSFLDDISDAAGDAWAQCESSDETMDLYSCIYYDYLEEAVCTALAKDPEFTCAAEIYAWEESGTCSDLMDLIEEVFDEEPDDDNTYLDILCDKDNFYAAIEDVSEDYWEDECADSSVVEDYVDCLQGVYQLILEDDYGYSCTDLEYVCSAEITAWQESDTCLDITDVFEEIFTEEPDDDNSDYYLDLLCDIDNFYSAIQDEAEDYWEDDCADTAVEDFLDCTYYLYQSILEDDYGYSCPEEDNLLSGSSGLHLSALLVAVYCFLAAFLWM